MDIKDIVVGETYQYGRGASTTFRVSGKGDSQIVTGYWSDTPCEESSAFAKHLQPILKRYVVEMRLPKAGERYFIGTDTLTAKSGHSECEQRRLVIIEAS